MSSDSKLFLEGGRTASGGSRVRPIPCTVCHGRRELTLPPRCNHNGSHCPCGGVERVCTHCEKTRGYEPCADCWARAATVQLGDEYFCTECGREHERFALTDHQAAVAGAR
jgi:hypothetical protein